VSGIVSVEEAMAGYRVMQVDSELSPKGYVVEWSPSGKSYSLSMMKSFGLFDSDDQALEAVVVKLASDPFFAKKWSGGSFHAKQITKFVRVP
jgi:hypothetical protein